MTTDPFVTLVFLASVGLLILGAFALWEGLFDLIDRRRNRLSRDVRRRIRHYGWPTT